MAYEILSEDEFVSILAMEVAVKIGESEGGASYRRGDDLLFWHDPGTGKEYVLDRWYFRIVPGTGEGWTANDGAGRVG